MRITGNRMLDLASAATSKQQEKVAEASNQVSSGMRVTTPSDDPAAWLAAQRTKLHKTLSESASQAMQAGRERLDATDGALASLGDTVSQVRALAVQGANASYSPEERAELGIQVGSLFQAALGAANTKAPDGEYLLAGSASLTQPFDATGAYTGDAATRDVPTGESQTSTATVAGADLTAARGVDVLPLLGKVATALSTNDTATLATLLPDLDTAIHQVSLARSRTGGAISMLDASSTAQAALAETMDKTISRYVESDTVSAASELAKASQALEVSRAVSSHIVQLLSSTTSGS